MIYNDKSGNDSPKIEIPAEYRIQDLAISHLKAIIGRLTDSSKQDVSFNSKLEGEVGFTGSYVLINFELNGKMVMYRFPCKSPYQMRRSLLGKHHFGNESFFPHVYYDDESCFVEEFCSDNWLASPPSDLQLEELGKALSKIHVNKANGWGWLRSPGRGESESLEEFIPLISHDLKNLKQREIFSTGEFDLLDRFLKIEPKWCELETRLIHGDLHYANICGELGKIKLIDWDRIAALPPEYEFKMLYYSLNKHEWDCVMRNYTAVEKLDYELIRFFALGTSIRGLNLFAPDTSSYENTFKRVKEVLER